MRKSLLTIWMILLLIDALGQDKVNGLELYSEPGEDVTYFSKIEKVDSLWHWQLIFPRTGTVYLDGWYIDESHAIAHGKLHWFYENRNLKQQAEFVNGLREGITLRYDEEGLLTDSIVYQNGNRKGIGYRWHSNGLIADSAYFDGNGNGTIISWDESGILESAGHYINETRKQGRWKYFHSNGVLHAIEDYKNGYVTAITCYNEKGELLQDCESKEPAFKGGAYKWANFIQKNLNIFVPIGNNAPSGNYTVIIQFVVEKDGKLRDFKPLTNHGYGMEKEVIRVLKASGNWEPAVKFGVKVKALRKQPLTFML